LTKRDCKYLWGFLSIVMVITLLGCTGQKLPSVDPYLNELTQTPGSTSITILIPTPKVDYVTDISFTPTEAKYFDLINNTFSLSPEELTLLEQNGFFVSDRLAFTDFTTAYAYIYWKDLPVLVTTDSILHAIHQTYDDLLIRVEQEITISKLTTLLDQTRKQIKLAAGLNSDPVLDKLYTDLDVYLTVPLTLLSANGGAEYDTPGIESYVQMAQAADSITPTGLFNNDAKVDFTVFKPRGHYTKTEELERYFRAVSWLGHIDFPVVRYSEKGDPTLNMDALIAAALFRDSVEQSGQRTNWETIDFLLGSLIGHSDNMTLSDLDRLLIDAGIKTPEELITYPNPDQILQLLINKDYGQQRITGQILSVDANLPEPINRPVSFLLLGQRFTVDSFLMGNLVYDRLVVDGEKVQRPLPNPLDILYILGNDRAVVHLQDELNKYGYYANIATLRSTVDIYTSDFWDGSVYNRWLEMLRKLNVSSSSEISPQALRTAAWADKMLHTQLASWAQLRHDNILYTKQSYTIEPVCEYPAGYVEPFPEFYVAIQEYAAFGQTLFNYLKPEELTEGGLQTYQTATSYFKDLDAIARLLQTLSEKELRLEPFSQEEELFLKSIAMRQLEEVDNECATVTREKWDGWYIDLFPWQDDNPALIADIHTNPNTSHEFPSLLPPSVLHIATGPVAVEVLLVDTDEGVTAYIGPAFTYFEVIAEGYPPVRLTDEEWNEMLQNDPRPKPPVWTKSFRIPSVTVPEYLELP
jgi:hypothetical protein